MTVKETKLEGLIIIEPHILSDDRGYFFESFRLSILQERGFSDITFVQDNESKSHKGSIRGLHLQAPPFGQDKLIRVVRGSIFDVAVDIRKDSDTYGHWFGIELNESNKSMLFVPKGFAHGFCCLEDDTIVQYKCSNYYNKASELGIHWNDKDLSIDWPITDEIVSEKDRVLPSLKEFKSPF